MATNQEYILKRGEVGTILNFTLKDKDGTVNLNGWTVTLSARRPQEPAAIDEAPCALAAAQPTTGKGKGTYEFTATTADIPAGTYNLEFKAVNPTGDVYYFPKAKSKPYATLTVIDPLS